MKKYIISWIVALMIVVSCQKSSDVDFEQVLSMNISLEQDILQQSDSNLLTLTIGNTSDKKVKLPKSAFLIEFTSYSGSVQKTLYLDPFQETLTTEVVAQKDLIIMANSVLTKQIDLSKILYNAEIGEQPLLPSDDYTINLIMNLEPETSIQAGNGIIRSNYTDVQVKV